MPLILHFTLYLDCKKVSDFMLKADADRGGELLIDTIRIQCPNVSLPMSSRKLFSSLRIRPQQQCFLRSQEYNCLEKYFYSPHPIHHQPCPDQQTSKIYSCYFYCTKSVRNEKLHSSLKHMIRCFAK